MNRLTYFFIAVFFISCKTTTYFIVRHTEKEAANTMSGDVSLSEAGKQRAEALKDLLQNKKVRHIYSTNYIRTRSTAQPLADASGIAIETYDPRDTGFVNRARNNAQGNVLIVGHSNTVDDLVNKLMGEAKVSGDLPETQYGDLFVVKKRGKKYSFEKKRYGL